MFPSSFRLFSVWVCWVGLGFEWIGIGWFGSKPECFWCGTSRPDGDSTVPYLISPPIVTVAINPIRLVPLDSGFRAGGHSRSLTPHPCLPQRTKLLYYLLPQSSSSSSKLRCEDIAIRSSTPPSIVRGTAVGGPIFQPTYLPTYLTLRLLTQVSLSLSLSLSPSPSLAYHTHTHTPLSLLLLFHSLSLSLPPRRRRRFEKPSL